jgi:three-Cys-motif partner protein
VSGSAWSDGRWRPQIQVDRRGEGSPAIAVNTQPPFKEYHFIDLNGLKVENLRSLFGQRSDIHIHHGDCNQIMLEKVLPRVRWEEYGRGLCLPDPYGLHLNWEVIRTVGQMKTIDMFLNFPIMDMNMNVFWHHPEGVDEADIARMTAFWGDESWQSVAYEPVPTLFGPEDEKTDNDTIAEAFRQRLQKVAGFGNVSEPIPMRNTIGRTVYYLFFASPKPVTQNIITAIFAKYRKRGDHLMAQNSQIEWTDATWNPVRGCTKITPGCDHCYAETFAERFRGVKGHPYEQGFDLRLVPDKLAEPLRWKTPKMIFVNSMSDLFHKDVPDDYVESVCRVMERANWHTYQMLTKRSSRMRNMLQTRLQFAARLPHVWWGVSVEDRAHGLPRVEHLRQAPAAVRFLSIEPLLEDLGEINLEGIHWVIVGGESGAGARPMNKEWVLSVRDQCERAQVPFFFKQWGGVRKRKAGRELEGNTYDGLPGRVELPVLQNPERLAAIAEIEALYAAAAVTPELIG